MLRAGAPRRLAKKNLVPPTWFDVSYAGSSNPKRVYASELDDVEERFVPTQFWWGMPRLTQKQTVTSPPMAVMTVKKIRQLLSHRGVPTAGVKAALIQRLEAMDSNEHFHMHTKQSLDTAAGIAAAEKTIASQIAQLQAQLTNTKDRITSHKQQHSEAHRKLRQLQARLHSKAVCFAVNRWAIGTEGWSASSLRVPAP